MSALILIIHIIVCLTLIIAILLQSGKSADLAGAFGGMGSQSVFGPRGAATILAKVSTICAILFMITSMGLWILSAKGGERSVVSGEEAPIEQKATVPEAQKTEGEEKKAPEGTTAQETDAKKQGEEIKKQESDPEKKRTEPIKK
ncbi:MAG: preprotein translocase subunit SecG [Candidatus Aminicenantes bacterium]|nr:MAG: preprotein translocase subunit SecG [Candidatus Aminicenantes bacterium]